MDGEIHASSANQVNTAWVTLALQSTDNVLLDFVVVGLGMCVHE
jgi:hypothetical protein